jgi:hypothetical protein
MQLQQVKQAGDYVRQGNASIEVSNRYYSSRYYVSSGTVSHTL